jgi:hypothetical protein
MGNKNKRNIFASKIKRYGLFNQNITDKGFQS